MSRKITDDLVQRLVTRFTLEQGVPAGATRRVSPVLLRAGLLALAVGLCGSPAWSQDRLKATISAVQEQREWIHVPVNKSVLIETNLPAVRQQTLSPEIAQIQSIS